MRADRGEVLRPPDVRQRLREGAAHDPRQVGIARRIEVDQRALRAPQDRRRDTALHVPEKARVASRVAHHRAREEQAEQQAPPPVVPGVAVERAPAVGVARDEQRRPAGRRMNQRQHPPAEEFEVLFELARTGEPGVDHRQVAVPVLARRPAQRRTHLRIQIAAPRARPHPDEFEQRAVFQRAEAGGLQFDQMDLRRGQIDGEDLRRRARQHRQRVVAARGDRKAAIAGPDRERCQQHVGVLPALRVAQDREVRARRDFARGVTAQHRSPPAVAARCA